MKLARIILPTSKPRELAGFLSEFFDLEVETIADQFVMEFGAQEIIVTSDTQVTTGGTSLEFEVDSKSDLDQLWQKYQFTLYRHSENPVQGALAPHEVDGRWLFEAVDIDGRRWRFVWVNHE